MKKEFNLVISASHPVIANHRVQDQPVLPGLAYIDLLMTVVRDALQIDCFGSELRDVVIYRPLIVASDDVPLTIGVSRLDGGAYAIDVAPDGMPTERYCTAELHPSAARTEPDLDLAEFGAAPERRFDLATLYRRARERGLSHDGLMHAHGVARRFDWGCLIELSVPPAQRHLLAHATFHPTLIDGAAVASSILETALPASVADEQVTADDALYLPLHYGAFRARAPLRDACIARVRLDRIQVSHDIRKLDIDFYDEAGHWLASLAELTGKRVRGGIGASPMPLQAHSDASRARDASIRSARTATSPSHERVADEGDALGLEQHLCDVFAVHLGVAPQSIDVHRGFFDMGLSSAQMLMILKDVERLLSRRLNPTLLFEYNTIDELLQHFRDTVPVRADQNWTAASTSESTPLTQARGAAEPARYRFDAVEPHLADHLVDGKPALMGLTYPCLALQACVAAEQQYPVGLEEVRFHGGPLRLESGQGVGVEIRLERDANGQLRFLAQQRVDGTTDWTPCCEGQIGYAHAAEPAPLDWDAIVKDARELPRGEIERWFDTVPAFTIGPALRSIQRAFVLDDGALVSEVDLTGKRHALGLYLDPLLLNVCYQFDLSGDVSHDAAPTFVPFVIERLALWRPMTERAVVVTRPRQLNSSFITLDATIYDDAGRCVAALTNASLCQLVRREGAMVHSTHARPVAMNPGAVAVVGMAGRFPQARDLDAFWDNLREGRDCITEIPAERWDWRDYYSEGREPGTIVSKWGGFIDDADAFDPLFFQISPREAEVMDPLERLFLQHCWMAMEDAGYTRDTLRAPCKDGGANGRVGVYAGVMGQEYPLFALEAPQRMGLGGGTSSVATRMSYFCDFNGPAMAVDTMCSSSLVAIGSACQALASGAINAAFAGGVNLSLHPSKYLMLSRGQFISSKGHCESFGEGGDGYIPGEGVGVLMLKRLDDAQRDGDMIHGVIRAVAVNHGGRASGYTVPNPAAQAQVIRSAIEQAGVHAADISYVEAHGTGTKLGDPVEIAGLTKAFHEDDARRAIPAGSCRIGSVKSNIGHCEGAAGVAGVLKVLLQMRHGVIVPSLHSRSLNPAIDFSAAPFTVNQALIPWPDRDSDGNVRPRVAGVSSFGAGGVNAHAILESYSMPVDEHRVSADARWLIPLSAREWARLPVIAADLLAMIERRQLKDDALPSLAYTLQIGREAMEHRVATVVRSMQELCDRLRSLPADAQTGKGWYCGVASANRDAVRLYGDADAQALLHAWLDKANLHALAQVWIIGVTLDWRRLYRPAAGFAKPPRRMSLPSYPFKTERYWIAPADASTRTSATRQSHSPLAELFMTEWRPCSVPEVARSPRHNVQHGFILILTTDDTRALGERIAALRPGARLAHIDHLAEQVEQLCKPNSHALAYVVDLTALDAAHAQRGATYVERWLPGLQRLVEHLRSSGARFLSVTRYLEALARPESAEPTPHAALVACLYRSLGFEYPRLESGHLDIDLHDDASALPHQILAQLECDELEPRVCMRDGLTYLPRFVPLQASESAQSFEFPETHTLWITGGTRGLGLLCAQHFVEHYGVRKLVLSGRESLPPTDRWPQILANPHDASVSPAVREKIAAIDALRRRGAKVLALNVELTDGRAMDDACATIVRELGPIGGVIHCAGVGDANPAWIRKNAADMQAVFAPKVAGLDGLCRAVRGQPLSFFIVYSSVCAALPSLATGQIDYAMANAYMDAFAQHRPELGIMSLQWPSWTQTGMGAMDTDVYRATGLVGLTNQEGLALLDRALALKRHAVVMPALVDPAMWPNASEPFQRGVVRAANGGAGEPSVVHLPASAADDDALAERTKTWLRALFAAELKMSLADFDTSVDFSHYGLDSILMAQILHTINVELELDLAPSLILEQPNLAALSAWFLKNEQASLARYFADAVAGTKTSTKTGADVPETAADVAPDATSLDALDHVPGAIDNAVRAAAVHTTRNALPESDVGRRPVASGNPPREVVNDIVVVGMSARFPGAPNLTEYWRLLSEGHSAFSLMQAGAGGAGPSRFIGALDHRGEFDRETFHIPVEDFDAMDPQALMVLEECVNLWAHAGYCHDDVKGSATGVFLGGRARASLDPVALQAARNPIVVAGQNYLAANVSHFFDLSGPSLVIDTACSSALVGMQLASQALRAGEITAAIVGGIHLLDVQSTHGVFEQRGLLSAGDQFHLFDERADGIIVSEGVGLVLLKTAEQARLDGDTVYARISALSCNNDGRTAGPATPNLERQMALMRKVLAQSGLTASQINYIETNGSGTKVTDLLELKAIDAIYGRGAATASAAWRPPCALGSIKPNIGHPLCAEGIASFIKAVLMLYHGRVVPFLSGQQALRHFDLDASPFYFPRDMAVLPDGQELTIAINCFADGGTNAHAILQRADVPAHAPLHSPLTPPPLRRQAQAVHTPFIEFARARDAHTPNMRATTMIWEQFQ
ncbi:polyketide synthase dehydratase domain-containing protein [Mycetohabitans sp. B8]|uniref:Polyketide synthase NecG n=1 Tax=Burkholderia sp. B8(2020) TaxID=2713619 RepID=A0A6G6CWU4_9BURK|nr:beta-ketoacyl synthase N-terminal-like domain-containing protein [Mycetohabitans sp. B8]MCG1043598.1 polyketide synthase dehydratase domain-containing protein [Mycetohabitans sp. B8]QIE07366.1 polyketide synthase NecG [Burkholderia sp. B8(2020)]